VCRSQTSYVVSKRGKGVEVCRKGGGGGGGYVILGGISEWTERRGEGAQKSLRRPEPTKRGQVKKCAYPEKGGRSKKRGKSTRYLVKVVPCFQEGLISSIGTKGRGGAQNHLLEKGEPHTFV